MEQLRDQSGSYSIGAQFFISSGAKAIDPGSDERFETSEQDPVEDFSN